MTEQDYSVQTRAINARVYRVFIISSWVAIVLAPLTTIGLLALEVGDSGSFAAGFAVALFILGGPLFLALQQANERLEALRKDMYEDLKAENFLALQKAIKDHKEARSEQDQV
jgi:hypothetical protein